MQSKLRKFVIVIPARYRSSRFMGKPMFKIKGIPMIVRTYHQCIKVVKPNLVFVATDDKRIINLCIKENINVVKTSNNCLTGTDRVFEVSKKINAKIYINIQGDEPLFNPLDLKRLIKEIKKYPNEIITGYTSIEKKEDYINVNIPKVVISENGYVLYASRSPIPGNKKNNFIQANRQVCAYAFPKKELIKFAKNKKKTNLEKIEDLEYLRFLEMGIRLKALKMSNKSIAVDTKLDVKKVLKKLRT